jgi:thioredoxin reductase
VLAIGDVANLFFATHLAKQARQFAQRVTIYTNDNEKLAAEIEPHLYALKQVRIESRAIVSISRSSKGGDEKLTLTFSDGQQETVGFLVHKPKTIVNGPFAEQLGLELTPAGDLKVGQSFPETNVKGCFALGDCATGMKSVAMAVSAGMVAAAGVSMQVLQ